MESFPAALGDQMIFGSGAGSVYAVKQVPSGGLPLPSRTVLATPSGMPTAATAAALWLTRTRVGHEQSGAWPEDRTAGYPTLH